jgi:hypothetical protein
VQAGRGGQPGVDLLHQDAEPLTLLDDGLDAPPPQALVDRHALMVPEPERIPAGAPRLLGDAVLRAARSPVAADVPSHLVHELRRDVGEAVVVAGVRGDGGQDLLVGGREERAGAGGDDVATGELLHDAFSVVVVWVDGGPGRPAGAPGLGGEGTAIRSYPSAASLSRSLSTRTTPTATPTSSTQTIGSKRECSGRAAARRATSRTPARAGTRRLTGAIR